MNILKDVEASPVFSLKAVQEVPVRDAGIIIILKKKRNHSNMFPVVLQILVTRF